MNNEEIQLQLFNKAMTLAAQNGWSSMSVAQAAQQADIPLNLARRYFPCKSSLLLYLNRLADETALEQKYQDQPVAEYLFDLFMSRFDLFQEYRNGIISALRTLPFNPPLAIMMGIATQNSMRWIAESAQINTHGVRGLACIKGLTAIWTLTLRVWIKDDSQDLSQTMASLDQAIKKAGKLAPYFVTKTNDTHAESASFAKDESYNLDENK
ncbi:TetR family transcriptional regulator [Commensalibacter oyaizuii]|uniref:TetR family transcriptional regulator n=1 Tax=Commensalibacter oyaizuii TaxID=3043873 RepID=A0ABT6Q195_9PROT|nr:TetR family transcriptional regulator [Commensalibacter sp. TBRC 16381]MDI2090870.1 TetR family transcriptional regulator [Commensalibacter sp. TBRC 16381]